MIARIEALLDRRLQRPDRVRRSLLDLFWLGLAYSMAIVLLAIGGVAPGMASWLAIPTEDYFRWEPLFTLPVIVLSGILAAAMLHLLARWSGGRGSFEDVLSLVGPITFIATLFTLVPDTVIGIALIAGWIDPQQWMADIVRPSPTLAVIWAYLLLYLAAFLALFPIIGRKAHGLKPRPARWCGWAAFAVYQAVLLVFIR
ncbi:MAG: hypothetical protein IPL52_08050 [Flavobacteriales bacterium]|nr:hypothetical protein [Flavobacteriales bacterium]